MGRRYRGFNRLTKRQMLAFLWAFIQTAVAPAAVLLAISSLRSLIVPLSWAMAALVALLVAIHLARRFRVFRTDQDAAWNREIVEALARRREWQTLEPLESDVLRYRVKGYVLSVAFDDKDVLVNNFSDQFFRPLGGWNHHNIEDIRKAVFGRD